MRPQRSSGHHKTSAAINNEREPDLAPFKQIRVEEAKWCLIIHRGGLQMRTNEEIIRQAGRSRSMMDFYMIQMEILLDIRTLVKELIEASSTNTRADETKRRGT